MHYARKKEKKKEEKLSGSSTLCKRSRKNLKNETTMKP